MNQQLQEIPGTPVSAEVIDLLSEILRELSRARAKFPGKNVTFAALVEEVGELATALAAGDDSARRGRKTTRM